MNLIYRSHSNQSSLLNALAPPFVLCPPNKQRATRMCKSRTFDTLTWTWIWFSWWWWWWRWRNYVDLFRLHNNENDENAEHSVSIRSIDLRAETLRDTVMSLIKSKLCRSRQANKISRRLRSQDQTLDKNISFFLRFFFSFLLTIDSAVIYRMWNVRVCVRESDACTDVCESVRVCVCAPIS